MIIEWNKVTWYSKLGAVILFILIVPILTFIIGREYQKTVEVLGYQSVVQNTVIDSGTSSDAVATVAVVSNSGISGVVIMENACTKNGPGKKTCSTKELAIPLVVKNSKEKVVTNTVSRTDGKFLLLLPPDTYKIAAASAAGALSSTVSTVQVTADSIVKTELSL